jgi:hypothetical protein
MVLEWFLVWECCPCILWFSVAWSGSFAGIVPVWGAAVFFVASTPSVVGLTGAVLSVFSS